MRASGVRRAAGARYAAECALEGVAAVALLVWHARRRGAAKAPSGPSRRIRVSPQPAQNQRRRPHRRPHQLKTRHYSADDRVPTCQQHPALPKFAVGAGALSFRCREGDRLGAVSLSTASVVRWSTKTNLFSTAGAMLSPVVNTELTDLVAVQPIQQSECTPYVMPPLPPRAPLSMLLPTIPPRPCPSMMPCKPPKRELTT